MSGKTEEEATRTGAVDRADDQVESMFAPQYKTINSPIHKAVWEQRVPIELFTPPKASLDDVSMPSMLKSIEVLKKYRDAGEIYHAKGKVCDGVFKELGEAGYWGMLIEKQYGGQGATVLQFMRFLSNIAKVDPTCAGLGSVHGCIGAVDPVRTFGNEEQKKKFLPILASGKSTSGFALTEPCAGSDLTALRTTAVLKGDSYILNGEKLFITNVIAGRTAGVVCLIDGKPAAIIVELPKAENDNFKLVNYGLHALKHAYNNGIIFKDFAVPKDNLLVPPVGDGLTIGYHGLNLGRLALCATATGVMKVMLANMLPWAHFRETYGHSIDTRELVKRRIARAAALIAGSEALFQWGSWLIDKGYRGELECVIAKIFGSEAQKEVAIELFMKTHGGRSFLHGHMFGDNVHEFLAPCIYEGEGEMLGMAFFKSLAKAHGQKFFEPVGLALQREKIKSFNPANPAHAFALRNELVPYAMWRAGKMFESPDNHQVAGLDAALQEHVDFAMDMLHEVPIELSQNMVKHQLKLADRQCRIADLSRRVQDTIIILVTSMWAHQQQDKVMIAAADILCQDLRRSLTGERPSDKYFRACSKLADMIIAGEYKELASIDQADILFSYSKKEKVKEPAAAAKS
jgi:alkylation response protein AidB-like acyl-CoA dehydrogenase